MGLFLVSGKGLCYNRKHKAGGIMFNLVCVPLGDSAAPSFFQEAAAFPYKNTMLVTSTRNLVQTGRGAGLNTATFDYLANAILRQAG